MENFFQIFINYCLIVWIIVTYVMIELVYLLRSVERKERARLKNVKFQGRGSGVSSMVYATFFYVRMLQTDQKVSIRRDCRSPRQAVCQIVLSLQKPQPKDSFHTPTVVQEADYYLSSMP